MEQIRGYRTNMISGRSLRWDSAGLILHKTEKVFYKANIEANIGKMEVGMEN
jgi:hypothetical protein